MATKYSRTRLEGEERKRRLGEVPEWKEQSDRDAIQRNYQFKDFKQAWAFMNKVADKAEELDHHPEWFNVYNKVNVTLATHDASGVTEYDIVLAKAMDEYASSVSK
eukprot:TRINITY_DN6056_c0_g1_i1.p1 TRINITY_DN6056_c0_g1~~TRINITY_DN6056_c0_g1_i1.p1  ORF type:complete len:106 (-),score=28.32 TRINITY_DN6056_c0_g1_i1:40-357(-)